MHCYRLFFWTAETCILLSSLINHFVIELIRSPKKCWTMIYSASVKHSLLSPETTWEHKKEIVLKIMSRNCHTRSFQGSVKSLQGRETYLTQHCWGRIRGRQILCTKHGQRWWAVIKEEFLRKNRERESKRKKIWSDQRTFNNTKASHSCSTNSLPMPKPSVSVWYK